MHPFDQKIIRRVSRHAAFVRLHGRYPVLLSLLWPGLLLLIFFGALDGYLWAEGAKERGASLFISLLALFTVVRVLVKSIRAHFYKKYITGTPAAEGTIGLQVALNAAGYSLEWTDARDAAVLFAVAGGPRKERHAVVFVPADGHIWYTVHDPSGWQFGVSNRKPLQHLLAVLDNYFHP